MPNPVEQGLMRVLLTLAALVPIASAHVSHHAAPNVLVFREVRLFDGERTIDHANVVVRDGTVQAVGGAPDIHHATTVIEGRGRTLLPGLIDSHVHVADDAKSALGQTLALGVTTVLDMFSGGERLKTLKRVAAEDSSDVADVRTAGTGVTVPGGHPTQMGGPPIPTLGSASEAEAFVTARIAEGADYIKIIYDDLSSLGKPVPMLDRPTLDAVIAAAHRHGKLAIVHVLSEKQAREAIDVGADVLAHLFKGSAVSPSFGSFASKHRVAIIPTLSVICGHAEAQSLLADQELSVFIRQPWRRMLEMPRTSPASCGAEAAVEQLIAAGVPVLAGTDAPTPGTTYGASLHGELSLLVRSGLSPTQALAAATSVPARIFGLHDRGSVRPGSRADLLLVDGDPTRNILATRRIVGVWKRGIAVERTSQPN